MKINYALLSRSLIALLFVVAGLQKLAHFSDTTQSIASLHIPLAGLVTLLVIIIEIPVAIAFAWGYRTCMTGWALIVYTALVTVFVHGNIAVGMNLIMALKNIAIIGGLIAIVTECACGTCPVNMKKGHKSHGEHNHEHHQ